RSEGEYSAQLIAEEGLDRLDVAGERLAAALGHAVAGARLAIDEALLDRDVAGLLQLGQVHREVAVGGAELIAEVGEVGLLGAGQEREDGQTDLSVNDWIKLRELRHRPPPGARGWRERCQSQSRRSRPWR